MSSPPSVEYVRLGNSGLKVSVPILGMMTFGSSKWSGWVLEEEESLPILKAAWDRGINTFDTANVYSNGVSETILGNFIKKNNIPRDEILVLTKCHGLVVPEDVSIRGFIRPELKKQRPYANRYGLSRTAIFNAVDASLKRLDLSYIDLLQIHRYDADTPAEETMKALHDLVQSGKVRYIGASSMRTWQFAHLQDTAAKNGWTKFVSMQNEISLLYREEEREMIPYCKFNGVGIIPWGPINAGNLGRPIAEAESSTRHNVDKGTIFERKFSDSDQEVIKRVEEVAKKTGKTMAQVALAWVGAKTTSPIIGASSVQRVDDSIVTGFTLTEEDKKYLEEPYVPKPVRGHT